MKEHKVYHIHVTGNHHLKDGYIGVTQDLQRRLRSHKFTGMFKEGDQVTVLCIGSREYCLQIELKLRPECHLGRNKSFGGKINSGCIVEGQRLSIATEIKKGERLSPETEFKKGMTPHNKGNGRDYIFTDPFGEEYLVTCITDFCKTHSLTPANMRKVAKGERNFHKKWKAVLVGRQELW